MFYLGPSWGSMPSFMGSPFVPYQNMFLGDVSQAILFIQYNYWGGISINIVNY